MDCEEDSDAEWNAKYERPTHATMIAATSDGPYTYKFELRLGCEYEPSNYSITGEILHSIIVNNNNNNRNSNGADNTNTPKKVGGLDGTYVNRNAMGTSFHEVCDSISGELEELSTAFCDGDGMLRYDGIDGLEEDYDGENLPDYGGFVHLNKIVLDAEHRHKDVGIQCFTALLDWLATLEFKNPGYDEDYEECVEEDMFDEEEHMDKTTKGWSFCAIVPSGVWEAESRADQALEDEACGHRRSPENVTDEFVAREIDLLNRRSAGNLKVRLQFARMGFQQRAFASSHFYLLPARLEMFRPPMSKEEVKERVVITERPAEPVLNAAERRVFHYMKNAGADRSTSLAQFQTEVSRHITAGADLTKCNGLHALVASLIRRSDTLFDVSKVAWILSQGVDINAKDSDGNTVLHVASYWGNQGAIRDLMRLGADKNVTNASGKRTNVVTNDARQDTRDFTGAFGLIGAFENEMRNMNESIALLENSITAARSGGPNP